MSWTKRQFVNKAFEEIGFASYTFDIEPEQLDSALYKLDAMIASWNAKGIRISYPLPSSPENSNIDTETNVPDRANEAIYTNLAIRLAPSLGKILSPQTLSNAKRAYNDMALYYAKPDEIIFPGTLPSGAGNKPWRTQREYLPNSAESLDAGIDSAIDFE